MKIKAIIIVISVVICSCSKDEIPEPISSQPIYFEAQDHQEGINSRGDHSDFLFRDSTATLEPAIQETTVKTHLGN